MTTLSAPLRLAAAVVCAGLSATSSYAAVSMPWTNAAGSNANFSWSGGGSDNGLFGDPIVSGNTFIFFPNNFVALDGDGNDATSVVVQDRLEVTILAAPGKQFSEVLVAEFGDYSIVGGGSVSVTGDLTVTNTATSASLADTLAFSTATAGSGNWTDSALATPGPGWTSITIELDNELIADALGTNSSAQIQKKVGSTGIAVTIIPEPGSLALLAAGAGLAGYRRRRRV